MTHGKTSLVTVNVRDVFDRHTKVKSICCSIRHAKEKVDLPQGDLYWHEKAVMWTGLLQMKASKVVKVKRPVAIEYVYFTIEYVYFTGQWEVYM